MRTASIHAEWEGRLIDGRFALLEWLGGSEDRGVFLTVLQGIRKAAIKLIPAERAEADELIARWEKAKTLSHPNLAGVLETGRCVVDGTELAYVVTEYGQQVLSQIIAERELGSDEASGVLGSVLDALLYLHEMGFVHGHVKPSNILIAANQVKLSADDLTLAGDVLGQARIPGDYDAPELVTGRVTPAADAWSVGMTTAEALTQRLVVWNWATRGDPAVPQSLPQPFGEIVRECLRTVPTQRSTIGEIKAQLAGVPPASVGTVPVLDVPSDAEEVVPEVRPAAMEQAGEAPARVVKVPAMPGPTESELSSGPAMSRWSQEAVEPALEAAEEENPVDFDRGPTLFADIEEANLTGFPVLPFVIGVVVLLAVAGVLLVRSGKIPWPFWTQSAPAASQAAPPTPSQEPSPGEAAPAQQGQESTPGHGQSSPANGASAPQQQPKESSPGEGENAPATGQAAPQQPPQDSSPEQNQNATGTSKPPPPAARPTHRASAEGAVAEQVLPNVPQSARQSIRGAEEAVVRIWVNRSGRVSNGENISPGPGNYFARIALRTARTWKFDPPIRGGQPQPSVWTLRFNFLRTKTVVSAVEGER